MRIRTRLPLVLLGASAVLAASAIGYRNARSSMTEAAERQLTGVRRAKAFTIENHLRTVTDHVHTLSESKMSVEGMEEFRSAFREIDGLEAPPDLKGAVSAYNGEHIRPGLSDLVTPRSSFDLLAQRRGVEKIKTIGDADMAVAGLQRQPDGVARRHRGEPRHACDVGDPDGPVAVRAARHGRDQGEGADGDVGPAGASRLTENRSGGSGAVRC